MNVSFKEGSRYRESDSGKEENAVRGGEKVARNSAKYIFQGPISQNKARGYSQIYIVFHVGVSPRESISQSLRIYQ